MGNNEQWQALEEFWRREFTVDGRGAFRALRMQHEYSRGSWMVRTLNGWMESIMARGRGKENSASKSDGKQWTRFVNIPLAGVLWADIESEFGDADQCFDSVSALLGSGYRLGLSFNTENDAFICSVTCRDGDNPNSGCTFTAFAGTWWAALQTALFKHYNIAHEDWNAVAQEKAGSSFG